METNALLPCPFCGSEASVYATQRGGMYSVRCTGGPVKCPVTIIGPYGETTAEAMEKWNSRAALAAAEDVT